MTTLTMLGASDALGFAVAFDRPWVIREVAQHVFDGCELSAFRMDTTAADAECRRLFEFCAQHGAQDAYDAGWLRGAESSR